MLARSSPFHRVNDSPIDSSVGIHTSAAWMSVGTPTIRPSTSRSGPDSRRTRRDRALGPGAAAGGATVGGAVVRVMTAISSLRRVQGLGLRLEVAGVGGAVLEEALQ